MSTKEDCIIHDMVLCRVIFRTYPRPHTYINVSVSMWNLGDRDWPRTSTLHYSAGSGLPMGANSGLAGKYRNESLFFFMGTTITYYRPQSYDR